MLFANVFFDFFPLHTKGRIRQHIVKFLVWMAIVRQRITRDNIGDILTSTGKVSRRGER